MDLKTLKIGSWNIAGVKDKLQNLKILNLIINFDIIWFLEIKTGTKFTVPGFVPIYNPSKLKSSRGGVVMLVKSYIFPTITSINTGNEGLISCKCSLLPEIVLAAMYIPPRDSLYFCDYQFGILNELLFDNDKAVVLGDFNSRVSRPVLYNLNGDLISYPHINDDCRNENGDRLLLTCQSSASIIVNNIFKDNKHFPGNLTYKKGRRWISEIDLCITNENSFKYIKNLAINNEITGSDHAILEVDLNINICDNTHCLLSSSSDLGKSYIPDSNSNIKKCPKLDK